MEMIITIIVDDHHTLPFDKRATIYDVTSSPQIGSKHSLISLAQTMVAIRTQLCSTHWIAPIQHNSNSTRVGHRFVFLRESLRMCTLLTWLQHVIRVHISVRCDIAHVTNIAHTNSRSPVHCFILCHSLPCLIPYFGHAVGPIFPKIYRQDCASQCLLWRIRFGLWQTRFHLSVCCFLENPNHALILSISNWKMS